MFSFGRRVAMQPAPHVAPFVALPPRGGKLIAEVHEGRLATLAAALIDGAVLEVGRVRALRVAGGRFLVETGHGSEFAHDAVEAVKRLLDSDAYLRAA